MTVVVEPPAAPAPRRPRRRGMLPAVIAGGVVVLLISGDVTSRQVVQHVMASKMQDSLQTPQRPSVHIGGAMFLPQLVRGRFTSLSLDARDANACQVRIDHAHAELRGVRQSHGRAHAASINGTGLLSYAQLNTTIAPLKVAAGDNGQVLVSVGFTPLGLAATATVTPHIDGSTLVIDPGNLTATVGGQQAMNLPLSGLGPIHLQLREIPPGLGVQINPKPDGLEFDFSGTNVELADTPCQQSSNTPNPWDSFGSLGQSGRPT